MPDPNDNVQAKAARLYGLDAITDMWEPINSTSGVLVTAKETIASDYGSSSWQTFGNDTTSYSVGDQIGTTLTYTSMFRENGGNGMVVGVTIIDESKLKPDIDVLVYNKNPNLTSTNNSSYKLDTADLKSIAARIQVRLGSYSDLDGQSIAVIPFAGTAPSDGAQWTQAASASNSLYVTLQAKNSFVLTSTSVLSLRLAVVE